MGKAISDLDTFLASFFWIGIWLKLKPKTTLTIYFEGIVHFHFPRRSLAKHGIHLQEFAKVEIPRIVGGKSLANSFSKWVFLKKLFHLDKIPYNRKLFVHCLRSVKKLYASNEILA